MRSVHVWLAAGWALQQYQTDWEVYHGQLGQHTSNAPGTIKLKTLTDFTLTTNNYHHEVILILHAHKFPLLNIQSWQDQRSHPTAWSQPEDFKLLKFLVHITSIICIYKLKRVDIDERLDLKVLGEIWTKCRKVVGDWWWWGGELRGERELQWSAEEEKLKEKEIKKIKQVSFKSQPLQEINKKNQKKVSRATAMHELSLAQFLPRLVWEIWSHPGPAQWRVQVHLRFNTESRKVQKVMWEGVHLVILDINKKEGNRKHDLHVTSLQAYLVPAVTDQTQNASTVGGQCDQGFTAGWWDVIIVEKKEIIESDGECRCVIRKILIHVVCSSAGGK